jgi:hypothetical protein
MPYIKKETRMFKTGSRQLLPLLAVLALAVCSVGCTGRIISEAMGKATGAKGITIVIDPISDRNHDIALAGYSQFVLVPFTDDFGRTPQELFRMMEGKFLREMAAKKIPNAVGLASSQRGKTLLIRGKIIHYEDSTRAISQVFGPFEEVVARVELVDKASGKVLGTANCIGRSKETVNQGVEKKADGLAEAIVSWIAAHYPKAEKSDKD